MNLRDLEYICAVAETGHFGQAAQKCHVSQPTLSGQIKKLEDFLGVAIFERARTGAKLTEVGVEIIEIAQDMLRGADQIKTLANSRKDPFSGGLSIGIIPTLAPSIIPHFVPAMSKRFTQLEVKYEEDQTARLTQRLLSGELDIALLATPPDNDSLIQIPLFDEPFYLAFPKGHPLESKAEISLSEIDVSKLLLLNEGHCLRDQALELCSIDGRNSANGQGLNAASLETLIRLSVAKNAMTLIPALAVDNHWLESSQLVVRELKDANAFRTVSLTFRQSLPRRAMIDALAALISTHLPETVNPLYRI